MLEKLDMTAKLSKGKYSKAMDTLGEKLGEMQRKASDTKKPIIILFEGWRGSRRGSTINKMMQQMDARGFKVHLVVKISDEERKMPFLLISGKAFLQKVISQFITGAGITSKMKAISILWLKKINGRRLLLIT
ncbi:MAG: hypothetical protein LUF25_02470 [Phascolarctobacterium sp.]|nr:hypothetical protein [Phascolarctobacterium sp.]